MTTLYFLISPGRTSAGRPYENSYSSYYYTYIYYYYYSHYSDVGKSSF